MQSLFVSFSFALLLTAMFSFRHRLWDRPLQLAIYFVTFMTLEATVQHFFLPPGAFGMEIGFLCLALAMVFLVVTTLMRRIESRLDQ
jgi:hypothetical protein